MPLLAFKFVHKGWFYKQLKLKVVGCINEPSLDTARSKNVAVKTTVGVNSATREAAIRRL